jgi:hypothetical protein
MAKVLILANPYESADVWQAAAKAEHDSGNSVRLWGLCSKGRRIKRRDETGKERVLSSGEVNDIDYADEVLVLNHGGNANPINVKVAHLWKQVVDFAAGKGKRIRFLLPS